MSELQILRTRSGDGGDRYFQIRSLRTQGVEGKSVWTGSEEQLLISQVLRKEITRCLYKVELAIASGDKYEKVNKNCYRKYSILPHNGVRDHGGKTV